MKNIGVVGTGVMGSGIAQIFAQNGYTVFIKSMNGNANKAISKIEENLNKLVHRKKINEEKKEEIFKNVKVSNYDELSQCKLVIEAVCEDIKRGFILTSSIVVRR